MRTFGHVEATEWTSRNPARSSASSSRASSETPLAEVSALTASMTSLRPIATVTRTLPRLVKVILSFSTKSCISLITSSTPVTPCASSVASMPRASTSHPKFASRSRRVSASPSAETGSSNRVKWSSAARSSSSAMRVPFAQEWRASSSAAMASPNVFRVGNRKSESIACQLQIPTSTAVILTIPAGRVRALRTRSVLHATVRGVLSTRPIFDAARSPSRNASPSLVPIAGIVLNNQRAWFGAQSPGAKAIPKPIGLDSPLSVGASKVASLRNISHMLIRASSSINSWAREVMSCATARALPA